MIEKCDRKPQAAAFAELVDGTTHAVLVAVANPIVVVVAAEKPPGSHPIDPRREIGGDRFTVVRGVDVDKVEGTAGYLRGGNSALPAAYLAARSERCESASCPLAQLIVIGLGERVVVGRAPRVCARPQSSSPANGASHPADEEG